MSIVYFVVYETDQGENILGNFMSRQSAEQFVTSIKHWFVKPLRILQSVELMSKST